MSKLHHSIWAGSLVCAIGVTIFCYLRFQEQLQERTNLLEARNHELEETRKEIGTLRQQVSATDAELERVQQERLELARLRNEVRHLRNDVASNAAIETRNPVEPLTDESERTPVNGAVQEFSAQTTVDVPVGDSLILGGWETSPGRRVVIMVEPSIQEGDGTEQLVQAVGYFIELPEEELESLGLDKTAGSAPDSAWLSNLSRERLFALVNDRPGIDILSAPRITIPNGQQGEISDSRTIDIDGEDYAVGASIQILPEILENGQGVKLIVKAGVVQPTDTPP